MSTHHKKILLAVVTPLLVIGLVFFIFWLLSFRVTKIDPNPVPLEARQITFYFSRDLDSTYDTKKIFLSRDFDGDFSVGKNSITFKPSVTLEKGVLEFTFNDLRAADGEVATVRAKTNIRYVPYNELSEEEQRRQISESDSNQGTYPITNGVVPHAAASWGVGYLLPEDTNADKLTLNVTIFADQGTNEPLADYQARLEVIYTEFKDYIESKGYKLSDYYLLIENSYLSKYDQPIPNEY